ncbi:hypothetical protein BaRGS_00026211 [Batillaria attramentaria]|uniref:Nucleotide-diphospho-sugar transferase domain-containing protein n=1 Tax=Batillaria attramentaria TaxID=370345 RepID=A0ABD0K6D4_9CAEN
MKKSTLADRMKTKNFYIVLGFIIISSGSIWLLSYPSPTFQNIVTKTHKGIKNLPNNMQIQASRELTVDPIYLSRLGLDKQQLTSSQGEGEDEGAKVVQLQPVIASSVDPQKMEDAIAFMHSVEKHLPDYRLVMFDLGLSEVSHVLLKKYCNSTWKCEVLTLDFQKFPSHVADLSIKSYRPICIQEMLKLHGAVIWADSAEYFQSGNLTRTLEQAKSVGLVAWTIEDPTSAITHPKMFDFFKTKQDLYYFHRAIETSHMVVYNTPRVKTQIMLPWVKCALLEECINPTGAQNVGCNFIRKPLFLYSGCHYYDMSALNTILGPLFDYDERPYTAKDVIFGNLVDDRLAAKNASDPLHRSRLKLREYLNGKVNQV